MKLTGRITKPKNAWGGSGGAGVFGKKANIMIPPATDAPSGSGGDGALVKKANIMIMPVTLLYFQECKE